MADGCVEHRTLGHLQASGETTTAHHHGRHLDKTPTTPRSSTSAAATDPEGGPMLVAGDSEGYPYHIMVRVDQTWY